MTIKTRAKMQHFGGDWTEVKIEAVRKYLAAYTQALKYQPSSQNPWKLIYIDAFAGTGHYFIKDKEEDLVRMDGSAKIALELDRPFSKYYFVDKDSSKLDKLKRITEKHNHLSADFIFKNGDCNHIITEICNEIDWTKHRAVMFLDPFGLQVSWKTIQKIAETTYIDLWFLFPIFAINRMLKKNGEISAGWRAKLDDVLGTDEWYDIFYTKSPQINMWDDKERFKKTANFDKIIEYIVQRLDSAFAGVSKDPRIFKTSTNSPLFALCFAVGNKNAKKLALKIAGHILSS